MNIVSAAISSRQYGIHFIEYKLLSFDSSFTEICYQNDINSALVQVSGFVQPLPKPMMTQSVGAHMHQQASKS